MQHSLSELAKTINFPLCKFIDELNSWPQNTDKQPISFLSGDPTIYGRQGFRMPQRGYEIIRQNVMNPNNHGYSASSGLPAFKQAVLKLYKSKIPVAASDVQINHGVNMGLLAILLAFTNEGDEVLVPEIGYPFYHDLCPALKRVAVQYKLKKDSNFQIDLQHAASLISQKTSFMYIINPTNPMGTAFTKQHILQILAFSDKHQIPLVCDEVYFKMVFPGVQTFSFGELTEDVPVIVLSGVQKILSVPGWVQSWTIMFDKHHILDQIKKNLQVIATIFLHTNNFVQQSMPQILNEVGLFTINEMPSIYQTYNKITQKLNDITGIHPYPSQGTIYLSVGIDLSKFKQIKSDKEFVRLLRLQQNVNLLPLSIFGQSITGFRLLTCGNDTLYNSFYQRLQEFVNRHKQ